MARHPTERNRRKPYLTNNIELGRVFRQKFTDGLRRLVSSGKLKLQDEWAKLHDRRELKAWLEDITESDWNVFIEGPPHGQSRPDRVLKYLARYLTGGPISDLRIIGDEDGRAASGLAARTRPRETPRVRSRCRARSSFAVGRCTYCPRDTRVLDTTVATTAESVLTISSVAESFLRSRCPPWPTQ